MKHSKSYLGLLAIVVVALGLTLAVSLVSQPKPTFDIRQRASTVTGTAEMKFDTLSQTRYVGDIFPVKVTLNTKGVAISGASFRFTYQVPLSGTPDLDVIDKDPITSGVQMESHGSTLNLQTTVNNAYLQTVGTTRYMYLDFFINTSSPDGYQNNSDVPIATIWFKTNAAGIKNIDHVANSTIVTRKDNNLDILAPVATFTLTLSADTLAPTTTILTGMEQGSTSTISAQTFTWTGQDNPVRPLDVTVPLLYQYHFDADAWSAWSSITSASKTLGHAINPTAPHIFEVRSKDPTGNGATSVPVIPTNKRTFFINLNPVLDGLSLNHGPAGTIITLSGYNFGATKYYVYFGTVLTPAADITTWTANQIVLKVPNPITTGAIGMVNVKVQAATPGTVASNTLPFTYESWVKLLYKAQNITRDLSPRELRISVVVKKTNPATYVDRFTDLLATWDAINGAYAVSVGPLSMPVVNTYNYGTDYAISIKDASRLRRKFLTLTLYGGRNNIIDRKADIYKMLAADFAIQASQTPQDNKLTIFDFGEMMTKIISISVPVTAQNEKFDLNGDNILDVSDPALLLTNFSGLEINGDPE